MRKCWYCNKRPRVSDNELFCKKCKAIKIKNEQSGTYIIYDKI